MTEDALAAVVAAAQLVFARSRAQIAAPAISGWTLAARVGVDDARRAGLAARAPSRWAMSGRLRD